MDPAIVNLFLGFLLTTVLGGVLGSYLQQRAWNHQNEAHLKEEELKRSGEVCESISQLLDKRLYRMRRLYFACQGYAQGILAKEVLERRLQDYDEVLYEWNDKLKLNLALIGTYFGKLAHAYLNLVYQSFKDTGSQLEEAYRTANQQPNTPFGFSDLLHPLDQLNQQVYGLGAFMMTQLRGGQVGRRAPEPLPASPSLLKKPDGS